MKKTFLISCALTAFLAGSAMSQDDTPDVASLVADVTTIAEGLQFRVATLGDQIAASSDAEAGTKALDEMLAAAQELQDSLGRDSELWDEMNGMMDVWAQKRDDLLERAKTLPKLKPVAEGWQSRIDEGLVLREKILEQAAESEALIAQIEEQREVIIAYYDLDLADQALETMRAMSEELGTMNAAMSSILEQANIVAAPPTVAQE